MKREDVQSKWRRAHPLLLLCKCLKRSLVHDLVTLTNVWHFPVWVSHIFRFSWSVLSSWLRSSTPSAIWELRCGFSASNAYSVPLNYSSFFLIKRAFFPPEICMGWPWLANVSGHVCLTCLSLATTFHLDGQFKAFPLYIGRSCVMNAVSQFPSKSTQHLFIAHWHYHWPSPQF